jgi:hypothetical protein
MRRERGARIIHLGSISRHDSSGDQAGSDA